MPTTHESRGVAGFDLDVGPVIRASDRSRLERLCRYALRPPLATERLEELPDGRLKYTFRHPWRDGTTAVIMEPLDLLARLAALVPAPRRHALRYHGTLAPNSKCRARIVPVQTGPAVAKAKTIRSRGECPANRSVSAADHEGSASVARLSWAELMLRVFEVDVLECPRCKGRLRIIATVTAPSAVKAILMCLGLPARPPPVSRAREREQGAFEFDGGEAP